MFVSGASSGYYLGITVIAPCLLYGVIRMFQYNDLKFLLRKEMLYSYANMTVLLGGKVFAEKVLHYQSWAQGTKLVGMLDFWDNLGDIFLGYISLFYGLRFSSDYDLLTFNGIMYLCNLAVICGVAVLAFLCFRKIVRGKMEDKGGFLLGVLVFFHIGMYALIMSTYGAKIFESRYLIQIFFAMVLLCAVWIFSLEDTLLLKKVGLTGALLCLSLVTAHSYRIYLRELIDVNEMCQVKEAVAEIDSPVVYVYDWADLEMNMRVFDTDKVYKTFYFDDDGKVHIGHNNDYTYYDNPEEHLGKIILMTTPERFSEMPESFQKEFTLYKELEKVKIWYCDRNVMVEMQAY